MKNILKIEKNGIFFSFSSINPCENDGFYSPRQLSARLITNTAAGVSYLSSFSKLSKEPREDKFAGKAGALRVSDKLAANKGGRKCFVNGRRQLTLISTAFRGPPAIWLKYKSLEENIDHSAQSKRRNLFGTQLER